MTDYAFVAEEEIFRVLAGRAFVDGNGLSHPANWKELYSPEDLERYALLPISAAGAPDEGYALTGTVLQLIEGEIIELGTYTELPPAPVPPIISIMQAKMALLGSGLLESVEAAVAASNTSVQVYWSSASHLHRSHPVVDNLSAALGLTDEEVDNLFKLAITIV